MSPRDVNGYLNFNCSESYIKHIYVDCFCLGELKLSKILKNVKTNNRDEFSLHSLGIGFDVDYDFLEKLAQENHGLAQRIFGNQDTAAQLKVCCLCIAFLVL